MGSCCRYISTVAFILVIIGGINWGLIGLFNFNLVTTIFDESIVTKIIYILVGVAAVYKVICWGTRCSSNSDSSSCCKK